MHNFSDLEFGLKSNLPDNIGKHGKCDPFKKHICISHAVCVCGGECMQNCKPWC